LVTPAASNAIAVVESDLRVEARFRELPPLDQIREPTGMGLGIAGRGTIEPFGAGDLANQIAKCFFLGQISKARLQARVSSIEVLGGDQLGARIGPNLRPPDPSPLKGSNLRLRAVWASSVYLFDGKLGSKRARTEFENAADRQPRCKAGGGSADEYALRRYGETFGGGDVVPVESGGMLVAVENDIDAEVGEKLADGTEVGEALEALELLPGVHREELMMEGGEAKVSLGNRVLPGEIGAKGEHLRIRDARHVMGTEFLRRLI